MKLLTDVDGDEVSLVERAANRRRFLLLKGARKLDTELSDILEIPWEREGSLLDEIRKDGLNDETVEKAVVAAVRLLKGVEGEFSPELIEKIGTELYGRINPPLNTTTVSGMGDLYGSSSGDDTDGSASGAPKDGSGTDGELFGTGETAPKVAADHAPGCDGDCGGTCMAKDAGDGPEDDANDQKPSFADRFKRKGKQAVAKEDPVDAGGIDDTEGGTVEFQVPVQKEDGGWDYTGVPEEARAFFSTQIEKADKMAKDLAEAQERLQKADDTMKHREALAKAASLSHVAPADDLAPILKEAAEKLAPESVEKLHELLSAAETRIAKGDLFTEQGSRATADGTPKSDAYSTAVEKASEIVSKSDVKMSQEQALARVFEQDPSLYSKYLAETGIGRIS